MRTKEFAKLLKKNDAEHIIEEYMLGKYSSLTQGQLQKLIDKKSKEHQGRGGVNFKYKRKEVKSNEENKKTIHNPIARISKLWRW